jgi:hypothetical protein
VLVLLVWADGVQPFYAENSYDGTKDVRLFEIDINQISGLRLDVVDGFFDMD